MPYTKTPRPYKKEYEKYGGTEVYKKRRAKTNAARAKMVKAGKARKGDGKDVDHTKPISKGGTNKASNLKVISRSKNRAKRNGK